MVSRQWNLGQSTRPGETRTKRWSSVPSFWEMKGEASSSTQGVDAAVMGEIEDMPPKSASVPKASPQTVRPPMEVPSAKTASRRDDNAIAWDRAGRQEQGFAGQSRGPQQERSGGDSTARLSDVLTRLLETLQVLRENSAETVKLLTKIDQNTATSKSTWS